MCYCNNCTLDVVIVAPLFDVVVAVIVAITVSSEAATVAVVRNVVYGVMVRN